MHGDGSTQGEQGGGGESGSKIQSASVWLWVLGGGPGADVLMSLFLTPPVPVPSKLDENHVQETFSELVLLSLNSVLSLMNLSVKVTGFLHYP